jgi:hypothetical protein
MRILEFKHPMETNDEEYSMLQNIINQKRQLLLKKQRKVIKLSKMNSFLKDLKDDYLKYNNYIVKQKQDQVTALNLLNNYITDLSKSGQLSEYNIQDAKKEQTKIMKELKYIKTGLDKIINENDQVQNSLFNQGRISI